MTRGAALLALVLCASCGMTDATSQRPPAGIDAGRDGASDGTQPAPPTVWLKRVGGAGDDRILFMDTEPQTGDIFLGLSLEAPAVFEGNALAAGDGVLRLDRYGRFLSFWTSEELIGPAQQMWAVPSGVVLNYWEFRLMSPDGDLLWAPQGGLGWIDGLYAGPKGTLFGGGNHAKTSTFAGTTIVGADDASSTLLFELAPATGELLWHQTFPGEHSASFLRTSEGKLWMFYTSDDCAYDYCDRTLKLAGHDGKGKRLWSRRVNEFISHGMVSSEPTPDGGGIMSTYVDLGRELIVERFDAAGKTVYAKLLESKGLRDGDLAVDGRGTTYFGLCVWSFVESEPFEVVPGTVIGEGPLRCAAVVLDETGEIRSAIVPRSTRPTWGPGLSIGADDHLVWVSVFDGDIELPGFPKLESNGGKDIYIASMNGFGDAQ